MQGWKIQMHSTLKEIGCKDVLIDFFLTAVPFPPHDMCAVWLLNDILILSCLDLQSPLDMNMISFKCKAYLPLPVFLMQIPISISLVVHQYKVSVTNCTRFHDICTEWDT